MMEPVLTCVSRNFDILRYGSLQDGRDDQISQRADDIAWIYSEIESHCPSRLVRRWVQMILCIAFIHTTRTTYPMIPGSKVDMTSSRQMMGNMTLPMETYILNIISMLIVRKRCVRYPNFTFQNLSNHHSTCQGTDVSRFEPMMPY